MKRTIPLLVMMLLMAACREAAAPTAVPADTAVPAPTNTTAPTAVSTGEPTAAPSEEPPTAAPTATTAVHQWPAPAAPYDDLSRAPVSDTEQATFTALTDNLPPERDDVALAIAYRGVTELDDGDPPLVTEPLPVGVRQKLFVTNSDTNVTTNPNFELLHVSDHAYFWFDTTAGLSTPDEAELAETGAAFDEIYEQVIFYFGPEDNPGVDGDPRVHILNASPLTICDVTEATSHTCGLLGYVATSNILPQTVYPTSNEREMFVMNGAVFGSRIYLDVLAHEFRHMIENRYDVNDIDWAVEGSATLAEDLLGFSSDAIARGNSFLANPDQQLNRWTEGNPIPYYGQGYVLNRYIFNRLGEDLYRDFATHPAPGFRAIDAIAAANDLGFTAQELWLDWLAALAIHDDPNAPEIYRLREGLETAAAETINDFPFATETTVSQYAADYYRLFGDGEVTLSFTGSNHAPLLSVPAASGTQMWVANRANYSTATLTREFDLSDVESATLEYAVFHEIEKGYDFAYAAISGDGGQTWQGLVADNMQGDAPDDDPSDVAYADRFYSGRSGEWVREQVDLTPYAGQPVQIRFQYVTDPILTFGGLALDNIAIPEIGFYDDAETAAGWQAEGFVRATAAVPQQWHLQLITYEDGAPVVQSLPLDANKTLTVNLSLDDDGGGRPILIVAASAPMTLEPAHYRLELTP